MKKTSIKKDLGLSSSRSIYTAVESLKFEGLSESRKLEKQLVEISVFKILEEAFEIKDLNFTLNKKKNGKPFLINDAKEEFFLSYAHSNNTIVTAVSLESELGVDVEDISRFAEHKAYHKWLNLEEEQLLKLNEFDSKDACTIWTRKEALAKLTGLGYKLNFKSNKVFPNDELMFEKQRVTFSSLHFSDEVVSFATYKENKELDFKLIE